MYGASATGPGSRIAHSFICVEREMSKSHIDGSFALFSSLIFLILLLFIINLAPLMEGSWLTLSPLEAFEGGVLLYLITLLGLVWLTRLAKETPRLHPSLLHLLANVGILSTFTLYHFVLGAHRLYLQLPLFSQFHTPFALLTLSLYFFALGLFHYFQCPPQEGEEEELSPFLHALYQVQFLLPFVVPFLLYQLFSDLLLLLPLPRIQEGMGAFSPLVQGGLSLAFTLLFFVGLMIFLPILIQKLWRCTPLPESELKTRLETLCKRSGFRHGGMMRWTIMEGALSAAIIGVVPKFRYVMFTRSLLEELSPSEVEAVLAHEMGHSHHKHLILYPCIIFGMMLSAALFFLLINDTLIHFFTLQQQLGRGDFWKGMEPLFIFIPYALIIGGYFRIVFGYFSRQFERQADLYPMEVGLPGEEIINALDKVGHAGGGNHDQPNWHHFSLRQRIEFLIEAIASPALIQAHHTRVRRSLLLYFSLLFIGILFLTSSLAPNTALTRPFHHITQTLSQTLSQTLNTPLRTQLAHSYIERYQLKGDVENILSPLQQSFTSLEALTVPGVAEFYGAQKLLHSEEHAAALQLMIQAWKHFDFSLGSKEVPEHFRIISWKILQGSRSHPNLLNERIELFEVMRQAEEEKAPTSLTPDFALIPGATHQV